jgi:hypothetical protein
MMPSEPDYMIQAGIRSGVRKFLVLDINREGEAPRKPQRLFAFALRLFSACQRKAAGRPRVQAQFSKART